MGVNGLNQLTGFYRGIVKKHLDNGFCKIWIPGVYPSSWRYNDGIEKLPNAEQANPLFCASENGDGVFTYPKIDTNVWCFFANNDPNFPVYFASSLGGSKTSNVFTSLARPDIPNEHLVKIDNVSILLNNQDNAVSIFVKQNINKDKTDKDKNPLPPVWTVANEINLKHNGQVEIKSSSNDISLEAKNIRLAGSQAVTIASPLITINGDTEITLKSKKTTVDLQSENLSQFTVITKEKERMVLAGL